MSRASRPARSMSWSRRWACPAFPKAKSVAFVVRSTTRSPAFSAARWKASAPGSSPGVDATYVQVRQDGRIVSVAVIVAIGVNGDGRREVLGMAIGSSEAETFWTDFLRKLARRGLRGVKLVVSDAHEGLKAAVTRVLKLPGSAAGCT
jgi:Transposase, Mutator family